MRFIITNSKKKISATQLRDRADQVSRENNAVVVLECTDDGELVAYPNNLFFHDEKKIDYESIRSLPRNVRKFWRRKKEPEQPKLSRRQRRDQKRRDDMQRKHTAELNKTMAHLCDTFFRFVQVVADRETRDLELTRLNAVWTKFLLERKHIWRYDKLKGLFLERVAMLADQYTKLKSVIPRDTSAE